MGTYRLISGTKQIAYGQGQFSDKLSDLYPVAEKDYPIYVLIYYPLL